MIANLENDRRPSVTLHEVVILALALDVPPLALAVPADLGELLPIFPQGAEAGAGQHPYDAWVAFTGRRALDEREEPSDALSAYQRHEELVERYESARRELVLLGRLMQDGEDHVTPRLLQVMRDTLNQILDIRLIANGRGWRPPPLPELIKSDLEAVRGEET